ncbi:MAG: glycosyltransferase family protein [Bacteroidia bacterium]|nr:glycosyltransferase family protein [Bacteroidia bacterium]
MNLLIIQARMGSTRLPGKVLMKMGNKTLLEHLLSRVQPAKKINSIVVATTTNAEDEAIEKFCAEKNILCTRGSDWDVLDRFYTTAVNFNPENVIRLTSDCPLNSHKVVDFVMEEFEKSGKDYFSNSNHEPDFLEDGFDVEVFKFSALETAWKEAKLLSEREHVTPYIKNSKKFTCGWKKYSSQYTYKLSVDSENDFKAVSAIIESLKDVPDFGMEEVIDLLKKKPEILSLNKESEINSGYKKSLKEDKNVR